MAMVLIITGLAEANELQQQEQLVAWPRCLDECAKEELHAALYSRNADQEQNSPWESPATLINPS